MFCLGVKSETYGQAASLINLVGQKKKKKKKKKKLTSPLSYSTLPLNEPVLAEAGTGPALTPNPTTPFENCTVPTPSRESSDEKVAPVIDSTNVNPHPQGPQQERPRHTTTPGKDARSPDWTCPTYTSPSRAA
jgi:hypothetical protein